MRRTLMGLFTLRVRVGVRFDCNAMKVKAEAKVALEAIRTLALTLPLTPVVSHSRIALNLRCRIVLNLRCLKVKDNANANAE